MKRGEIYDARCTKRIFPTQVLIQAPDGGLERDSIGALLQLNRALLIALDLPGQFDNNETEVL